jgi:hypothetical protein
MHDTATLDWSLIQRHLTTGLSIPSYNRTGRNKGEMFEVDRVESDKIFVWPFQVSRNPRSRSRSRSVRREDFETVLRHWNDYHSADGFNIPTWNNSYCLAIICYVLEQTEHAVARGV